jgi:hypothetical protein
LHAAFIKPDGATSIANQSSIILNPDNGAITPPQLNLEPSPIVCQSARKFLRERIEDLKPRNPADPPKFSYMVDRIDPYLATVKWFADHHCGCQSELAALEEVAQCRVVIAPFSVEIAASLSSERNGHGTERQTSDATTPGCRE